MRTVILGILGIVAVSAVGWHLVKNVKSTRTSTSMARAPAAYKPPIFAKASIRYQGWTVEEWGRHLLEADRDDAIRCCQALRVFGAEGRPYVLKGLENSKAETRRLCLESLTVADFRALGDPGRRLLVKLSGDRADLRIRERATQYLTQWHRTIPAF